MYPRCRFLGAVVVVVMTAPSIADTIAPPGAGAFDAQIAILARCYDLPKELIHQLIKRESRYDPNAVNRGNYGLMQIRFETAKRMGYRGHPDGLRDPKINLAYGVPYLAIAFKIGHRDPGRALHLYSKGFSGPPDSGYDATAVTVCSE